MFRTERDVKKDATKDPTNPKLWGVTIPMPMSSDNVSSLRGTGLIELDARSLCQINYHLREYEYLGFLITLQVSTVCVQGSLPLDLFYFPAAMNIFLLSPA